MNRHTLDKNSTKSWGEELTVDEGAAALARCSVDQARTLVPYPLAASMQVLPLGVLQTEDSQVLVVACAQDRQNEIREALRFSTGVRIRPVAVSSKHLRRAIFIAYCGDEAQLEQKVAVLRTASESMVPSPPHQVLHSEAEIPSFVRALIDFGYAQRASDIHLAPTEAGTQVTFRIDGVLRERADPVATSEQHQQLVRHLKVLARLDPHERSLPQDGRIILHQRVDRRALRLSVMPTMRGERAVLRLGNCEAIPTLDDLGFDSNTLTAVRSTLDHDEGAIVLSGSTGSGKTTTLYAMVTELRGRGLTISSIENPVEVELEGVAQTELNLELGLDYNACLRSILRQDPDAIMLGELRDEGSTRAALQIALSGHVVLSTVHAANVFQVVPRLENLGVSRSLIAEALQLVVAQRLLPRLCRRCRVTDLARSQQLGFEVYRPVGCGSCFSQGVNGRVLVAESLEIDRQVRAWILSGQPIGERARQLQEAGRYVADHAQLEQWVRAGEVAGQELDRVASPHAFPSL